MIACGVFLLKPHLEKIAGSDFDSSFFNCAGVIQTVDQNSPSDTIESDQVVLERVSYMTDPS